MWNVMLMNEGLTYDYHAIDHFLGSSEHDRDFDYYGTTLDNLKPITDKIKIIKIDVEGHELEVCKGMTNLIYREFQLSDLENICD